VFIVLFRAWFVRRSEFAAEDASAKTPVSA